MSSGPSRKNTILFFAFLILLILFIAFYFYTRTKKSVDQDPIGEKSSEVILQELRNYQASENPPPTKSPEQIKAELRSYSAQAPEGSPAQTKNKAEILEQLRGTPSE